MAAKINPPAGGQKLIVIVGPTASGKSDLGIKIAKKISARGGPASGWNGAEIISADSRQVYRGMDVGTGKVLRDKTFPVPSSKVKSFKKLFLFFGDSTSFDRCCFTEKTIYG